MRHLSDEELQDLLDQHGPDADLPSSEPEDRDAMQIYRLLYQTLESEPEENLETGFTDRVMAHVYPAPASFPWLEAVIAPLLLIAAFSVTLLLLPAEFSQLTAQSVQTVIDLWGSARLDLALVAGLILVLVDLIDRRMRGRDVVAA